MSVSTNYTTSIPFKLNQTLVATSNNDSELWGFKIREMVRLIQEEIIYLINFNCSRQLFNEFQVPIMILDLKDPS